MIAGGDIFTDKRKTADKPLIRGKNHFSLKFWGEISTPKDKEIQISQLRI